MSAGKRVILDELAEVRARLTVVSQELTSKSDEYLELKEREADLVEAGRVLRLNTHDTSRTLAEVRAKLTVVWQELQGKSDEYLDLKGRETDLVEAELALRSSAPAAGRTRVAV